MGERYTLSIDIGTGSARAALVDANGRIVAMAAREHEQIVPQFGWARNEVPCKTNPLGVKGVGESGCTASLACVMSAVIDALSVHGVTAMDMPATPERVWRAIRGK